MNSKKDLANIMAVWMILFMVIFMYVHEDTHRVLCEEYGGTPHFELTWQGAETFCTLNNITATMYSSFTAANGNVEAFGYQSFIIASFVMMTLFLLKLIEE